MSSPEDSVLPGIPGYHPYNIQPWIVEVTVSMTVLALVSVALRLVSRRLKAQALWWDDWMILFSMGWNLAVVGFIFAMYAYGMGIHADLLELSDIQSMAKWLVVAEIFYAWNLGWTKLALLLMYYRIFRIPYFKKMIWIVGGFVWAWVICITFLFIFICVPVEALWTPDLEGRCINQVGTWIANAASTILTDVVILLLPVPYIWKLQLRRVEKAGLFVAFGLGSFVVFASAYRTSVLFTYDDNDPSYTLAPTVGWTAIEMSAGIVSANLPTMLPVVRWVGGKMGLQSLAGTIMAKSQGGRGTNGDSSSRGNDLSSRDAGSGGEVLDPNGKTNDGKPFYRLPDDTDSETSRGGRNLHFSKGSGPPDMGLRPDLKDFGISVNSTSPRGGGDGDDESGDDVPLHSIRVQKSVDVRESVV